MTRFSLLFILWVTLAPLTAAAQETRPNIVVILADDLGWGDVGWHDSEIPTPELDRLAQAGATLEQFYVQPVCSPTRAAFLTGRYPIRHGLQVGVVRPWAEHGLPLDEQTLADGLKSAGYATAVVGKWHLGHSRPEYLPTSRGFDHQYGHYNGAINYNTHMRDGGLDWHEDDQASRDQGYSTHLIAQDSVRWIEEQAGKQPFFLYVPFNAVHTPLQVPKKYREPFTDLKGKRKAYAGMLAAMDEAVGQIAAAVERAGVRDNTLFIFSSDNGGTRPGVVSSNGPLRAGKFTHYEGGVRAAAFATWDGQIPAGSEVNSLIHIVDLYPTLLHLADAKVEQKLPLDGVNVWDTIAHGKTSPRTEVLINATPTDGAIRVNQWKLVVNGGKAAKANDPPALNSRTTKLELFDLSSDVEEKDNLADNHPEIVERLFHRWETYQKEAVAPKLSPKPKNYRSPKIWGETEEP